MLVDSVRRSRKTKQGLLAVRRGSRSRAGTKIKKRVRRTHRGRRKKAKGNQHQDFPTGPPRQYYPGSMQLNFKVRMGFGALCMIWPISIKLSCLHNLNYTPKVIHYYFTL